ncbi:UNVERIFIED_CONTAM: hypothetical protein Slati_1421900 [Sesamum latifolium]|uniref:Reverse transcriptase domain-containing protein n=1 Tax=Sesamum latifolium TaxID=2727402 RepID=A0AAW2X5E3_9LAMI
MQASEHDGRLTRIPLKDHKKVSFITSDGSFCYVAMPFGLKNVGVTYQKLVDKIFRPQLGRNMEVYLDDMLVKSKETHQHMENLEETFCSTEKVPVKTQPWEMRIMSQWRTFPRIHGDPASYQGQPSQDQSHPEHGTPTNINEVQRLRGMIVALSRFISKSVEKCLPFFKTLRKVKNFEWTEEYHQAFEDLKMYLAKLPLLDKPIPWDTLYLYISSTSQAVSTMLV